MGAILSLSEIKSYLALQHDNDDARLQSLIDPLHSYVFTKTGRWFGCRETVIEERDYAPVIFLSNIDVKEIIYIKKGYSDSKDFDNDESLMLLPSNSYRWNDIGRITLTANLKYNPTRYGNDYLIIKYSYGIDSVPEDIKLACKMFVADAYRNIDGEITTEKLDLFSRSYKPSSTASDIFYSYGGI